MAIRELNLTNTAPQNNGQKKKEEAKVWLNVGYVAKGPDGEDTFISLPLGIPVDTMKEQQIRGSNESYNAMVAAKNALLDMLQKAGAEMNGGDEFILTDLKVQLRRVTETAEVAPEGNPFLAGMPKIG